MGCPYRAAVIGAGYWGPNLVRNFRGSPDWDLVAVCDLDEGRARKVVGAAVDGRHRDIASRRLLARDDIDAVAIATPARDPRAARAGRVRCGQARRGREAARADVRRGRGDGRAADEAG